MGREGRRTDDGLYLDSRMLLTRSQRLRCRGSRHCAPAPSGTAPSLGPSPCRSGPFQTYNKQTSEQTNK